MKIPRPGILSLIAVMCGFSAVSCQQKQVEGCSAHHHGALAPASGEGDGYALADVSREPSAYPDEPRQPKPPAQPKANKFPKGRNPDVAATGAATVPDVTYTAGSRANNYIALTFDDGPHVALTPRLLDILRERNVKATFFMLGTCAKARPEIVQRVVADGHELGNHSWSHRLMTKLSDAEVMKEFQDTHDALVAACGQAPKSQRPPYGAMTKVQRSMLKDRFGYPCILWDVDPLDWKKPGASAVASRILGGTQNGSIILLHDIHAGSVDAVPEVLDGLLAKGHTFVTVSQLLSLSGQ